MKQEETITKTFMVTLNLKTMQSNFMQKYVNVVKRDNANSYIVFSPLNLGSQYCGEPPWPGEIIYFNWAWRRAENFTFYYIFVYSCLTVIEVNYLFHAESAQNYLFKKNSSPPPWKSNGGPLRQRQRRLHRRYQVTSRSKTHSNVVVRHLRPNQRSKCFLKEWFRHRK